MTFDFSQDSGFLLEEELGLRSPALSSTYLPGKAGLSRGSGEELDLSFLPDELGTQEEPSCHNDTGVMSQKQQFELKVSHQ